MSLSLKRPQIAAEALRRCFEMPHLLLGLGWVHNTSTTGLLEMKLQRILLPPPLRGQGLPVGFPVASTWDNTQVGDSAGPLIPLTVFPSLSQTSQRHKTHQIEKSLKI